MTEEGATDFSEMATQTKESKGVFDEMMKDLGVAGGGDTEEGKAKGVETKDEKPEVDDKGKEAEAPALPEDVSKTITPEEEPVKKEEGPEGDDEEVPPGITGKKNVTAFKNLRRAKVDAERERDEFKTQIETLNAQMEEMRTKGAGTVETEKLQGRITELEEQVGKFDLTKTSKFRREHIEPMVEKGEKIEALFTSLKLDPKIALKASRMPVGERLAFLQGEIKDGDARSMVNAEFRDWDNMLEARNKAIKNWHEELKSAKQEEGADDRLQQATEKFFSSTIGELQKSHVLLIESQDNDDWNAARTARIEAAKKVILGDSPQEQIAMIVRGAMLPDMEKMYRQERKLRMAVENELRQRKRIRPSVGGESDAAKGNKGKESGKPMTASEVAYKMEQELTERV